jgi:beta-glucanase (GH16 family)
MMDRSNRRWVTAAAMMAVGIWAVAGARPARAQAVPGQWQRTWSAEFNAGASDLVGWSYDLGGGGWGNNEREVYTASSQNAYVAGGALHIAAIATGSGAGQTYTSARIKSNAIFSQAYGLFEFRAKLPAGTGLWPALWMMPRDSAYGGWPASGEIDVLESQGQNTRLVQGSLQSGPAWYALNTQTATFASSGLEPAGFSTTAWHTYDLEWTAGSPGHAGTISWYVDGIRYQTRTGGWTIPSSASPGDRDAPFDQPFYIIMNLAVGGNYVGDPLLAPGTYETQVDYARAFRIAGDATGDGLADADDLSVLLDHLNTAVTGGYAAGDFTGDGRVNADDLAIYDRAVARQAGTGAPMTPAVPEPCGAGLLAATVLIAGGRTAACLGGRRRRTVSGPF